MTNHTPGPWYEAKTGNHQGLIISEADGANIAVTYDKKDAALIAAAPDLLEALEQALLILNSRGRQLGLDEGGPVLDNIRAAIAKARAVQS